MRLFTSESVMSGHPDKVADLISDTILDACLTVDPDARVACETLVCPDTVVLAGEITCKDFPEYVDELVKGAILDIGYGPETPGFDPTSANFEVINKLHAQSRDIAMGVDTGGAGDQGIMFGYACNETPSMMPFPIYAAHEIGKAVSALRHDPSAPWVRPDGKTQVSVNYREDGSIALDNVLVSISHAEGVSQSTIRKKITEVVDQLISSWAFVDSSEYSYERLRVNPTGCFSIYGPVSDSGLTGRKIIVDTYGGSCAHGGGSFAGKDSSKVDRSAAYMARFMAKQVVATGLVNKCTIQLAYAIGVSTPVGFYVKTEGPNKVNEDAISRVLLEAYGGCQPRYITERLKLKTPLFRRTTNYGHFGKDFLPWEDIDMNVVERLRDCM